MKKNQYKTQNLASIDPKTGEMKQLEGAKLVVSKSKQEREHPYSSFVVLHQFDPLDELAADPDISKDALRVFIALIRRIDFDNWIRIPQTEIAARLGIPRQNVNRAIKYLENKGVILRGHKIGNSSTFKFNPHYGWRGDVDVLRVALRKLDVFGQPMD